MFSVEQAIGERSLNASFDAQTKSLLYEARFTTKLLLIKSVMGLIQHVSVGSGL
jgi:hypothetical protein